MTEQNNNSSTGIVDYLVTLQRWKKFILLNVVVITVIAAVVSFILPKMYTSSATVLPPRKQDVLSTLGMPTTGLLQQLGPLRAIGTLGVSTELYNYLAILQSRTLLEQVVNEFNLMEVYKIRSGYISDAIEGLGKRINTKVNEEGTLTIEVKDRDPERAKEMTNYLVMLLDRVNRDLSSKEARENRIFIEHRVKQNEDDLRYAEDRLKEFQEQNLFVVLPEQTESSISAMAQLYASKEMAEIRVGILERTMSEENPLLRVARMHLDEVQRKIGEFPELGVEYFRLFRDFTIQQELFKKLVPLLEQARIDEQRDTPTLLILDHASVPERASWPKKKIIVVVFFTIAFIASMGVAFFFEGLARMKRERPGEFNKLGKWFQRLGSYAEKKQ